MQELGARNVGDDGFGVRGGRALGDTAKNDGNEHRREWWSAREGVLAASAEEQQRWLLFFSSLFYFCSLGEESRHARFARRFMRK